MLRIRCLSLSFPLLIRNSSGSGREINAMNPMQHATMPPTRNNDCQPYLGRRKEEKSPAHVAPIATPACILVASVARLLVGAYSDAKASALGTAPPRPSPAIKRSNTSCGTVWINAIDKVKIPNVKAETSSICLRPKRSASMPKTRHPISAPTLPRLIATPRVAGVVFKNSAILGNDTLRSDKSKPSKNARKKHIVQIHV